MPVKSAQVKNDRRFEALKEREMFWVRASRFAVSAKASTPWPPEFRDRRKLTPGRDQRLTQRSRP